jgi:predicted CoA-binding protein
MKMAFENPSRDRIKEILQDAGNIAIVGLSDRPDRVSYMVAGAMMDRGYRIIPVNPKATEILGEKCYPTLKDIPEPVDIVNVFRRSDAIPEVAEEAIAIGAKTLWTQLEIIHEGAAQQCLDAGMNVIMDRCIKVEDAILKPVRK